jgi:hypothetical protein
MYLIVAKLWTSVLPLVEALRTIGSKLPINECCCRYLWGVIIWAEGKDSVLEMASRVKESLLADEDEEILALVAADMHQDAWAWKAVWQKDNDKKPPTLDISQIDHPEDLVSVSETSNIRSGTSFKTSEITSEGEQPQLASNVSIKMNSRQVRSNRWNCKDETWDSMLRYICERSDEERQMKDIKTAEAANVTTGMSLAVASEKLTATKEEIQQRMSIHNFL